MTPQNTKSSNRKRSENRYLFHWPVAIVFDSIEGQGTYHGRTNDVSLTGCSILTEHNVFSTQAVTVLLSLPSDHAGERRPVIEVKAAMVYTVLAAGAQKFRCGIHFLDFKGNGLAALDKVINERAVKVELGGF